VRTTPKNPLTTPRWPLVLFDLDGTLANSIDLIVASYNHALSSIVGRTVTPEVARSWIGQTLAQTFRHEDPAHAAAMETAYREHYAAHLDMITGYPGVPEVLRDLVAAGAATGIVTAKRAEVARWTITQAGLDGVVPLLGAMENTTSHKPDPAPLLAACAVLGADPTTGCYVGDAVYDIQAAHAAGMVAVAVTWGAGVTSELVATGPDHLCRDADELRAVLMG